MMVVMPIPSAVANAMVRVADMHTRMGVSHMGPSTDAICANTRARTDAAHMRAGSYAVGSDIDARADATDIDANVRTVGIGDAYAEQCESKDRSCDKFHGEYPRA